MTVTLSQTPVIETDRLILRAPQAGDWPAWDAMLRTDRARFIRAGEYDQGQAWRGFGHVIGHWVLHGWGNFIFTAKGNTTPLGMTGPWFPKGWPERELGWSVWSPKAEGQGFAFEAAGAVRDHAFAALGWNTAVSYIAPDNTRSIALAERLGAQRDTNAIAPYDNTALVYRHPKPERTA